MDRKELLKKDADFTSSKGKEAPPAGMSAKLFGLIKLILAILLLPFVYSVTVAFLKEFALVDQLSRDTFWLGVAVFLIVYLFVWEPVIIYNKGHQLLEFVFSFFKPLVKVAPYLLPIYTIVLAIALGIAMQINKSPDLMAWAIFLFGFTIALHLVFSAKTLRGKQGDFLRSNYIFGFSFVYILNVSLVAFIFNCVFAKYSFVTFAEQSYRIASGIFSAVFKQLFL